MISVAEDTRFELVAEDADSNPRRLAPNPLSRVHARRRSWLFIWLGCCRNAASTRLSGRGGTVATETRTETESSACKMKDC